MASLYETYRTDKNAEAEIGITLDFGPASFVVRRAGGSNKRYQSVLRQLITPVRRQVNNETIAPEALDKIFMQAYARAVVIDWFNVTDENNNQLPFNEANFCKVMTDLPDLWRQLQEECDRLANFRVESNRSAGESLGN